MKLEINAKTVQDALELAAESADAVISIKLPSTFDVEQASKELAKAYGVEVGSYVLMHMNRYEFYGQDETGKAELFIDREYTDCTLIDNDNHVTVQAYAEVLTL